MKFAHTRIKAKYGRMLILAAATTLGLLGVTVGPAAAVPFGQADGSFRAGTAMQVSSTCAAYGNYTVRVTDTTGQVGSYNGPVVFQANSTSGQYWGSDPAGTHPPVVTDPLSVSCTGPIGAITGFSGTLTGTNNQGQVLNCTWTGTFMRSGTSHLDITYQSSTGGLSGACFGATSVTVSTTIVDSVNNDPDKSACDTERVPHTCLLGGTKVTST